MSTTVELVQELQELRTRKKALTTEFKRIDSLIKETDDNITRVTKELSK